jgi:hypothetical protein
MTGTFLCHHHDAEEIDLIAAAIKAHANEFRKKDDLAYPQQRLAREIQDQQKRDGFITGFAATSGPIGPSDLVMPCGPNGPAGPDPPLQNAWLDDGEKLPVIGEMAASHGLTAQQITAKPSRQREQPAPEPNPLGLRTRSEAAARLRMSLKTFDAHVDAGAIRYVLVGRGTVRQRKMFTDPDFDEFVANQTRKDVPLPCLSAKTRAHRIGNTISNGEVVAFSARPRKPTNAKPKR